MSLTLPPVNSSLFIKPEPTCTLKSLSPHSLGPMPPSRVHSLESLDHVGKGTLHDRLTGRWLDGCPAISLRSCSRLVSSAAALGTTFPPETWMGQQFRDRMRRIGETETCYSEPNLTPANCRTDEDEEDVSLELEDEDHLFEFDLCSDKELNGDFGHNDDLPPLRRRTLSDSAPATCLHRKVSDGEDGRSRPVFSVFGSTSSGLGSERRSSQETLCELDVCKSYEPAAWRDYMNERMSTPVDEVSNSSTIEGSATPIQAASPGITSPFISPDSLLEGQHLQKIELFPSSSCPQCDMESDSLDPSTPPSVLNICDTEPPPFPSDKWDRANTPPTTPRPKMEETKIASLLDHLEDNSRCCPRVRGLSSADTSLRSDSTSSFDELGEITPLRKFSMIATPLQDEENERPRLRKCSSLKSGRTPPGTPSQRKIVRFADIFGLDLSEVKTFTDEIPKIPRCAFRDLDVDLAEYDVGSPRSQTPVFALKSMSTTKEVSSTSLVPMFTQPGCSPNFFENVRSRKVCLENVFMTSSFTISGMVRVLNLDFNKSVSVRWTSNDWSTQEGVAATYVNGSSDGMSDKFQFKIFLGSLPVGSRVQFCVCYTSTGNQFWDNNNGANYVFQVFLSSNSPGGLDGMTYRSCPVYSRNPFSSSQSLLSHQSPSQHGDDPWMRYM